ncbi:uncharacterized protein [Nicotiana sylvestris]|uniref:uncharacterized protein n=1 Tax=Nicotiana sylvestris TaxID=4096 RepID=UPI00388C4ED0
MAPYDTLYRRQCQSPMGWFEQGEERLLGTNLVQNALVKVLLRDSSIKGVMRIEKKGKLSPRYIRTFEVLERIGEVAYRLALPPSISSAHLVFHVSMLQKYVGSPSHVFHFSTVQLDGDLSYDVEPMAILD